MSLDFIFYPAFPEIFLAVWAMVMLMVGAFGGTKSAPVVSALSALGLLAAAVLACNTRLGPVFSDAFVADGAAVFTRVSLYVAGAVAILLSDRWLAQRGDPKIELPVLILLASVGMGMMAAAGDLIALYVGVELHSLALYVLAAFRRDDAKASEAGLKYFVLGALASGILLYGASLIYGFAGSVRFDDIAVAVQGGANTGVLFGLIFVICGLGFKVSAAPFHMWTPDVYEGAPTPIVVFLTTAPKLAPIVLLARLLAAGFPGAIAQWQQVIVALSLISVAVGAFAGLAQKNLKRLLAYSSIANIGYALAGMAAGTTMGMQSMLVFMILYMIDVTGLFAVLLALSRDGRPMERIEDFAGLARERPALALAMTVLCFSVMGIPPFSGFWAKVYVFRAAIDGGLWPVAAIALVGSVVAAFYYLRIVKVMWMDPAPGSTDRSPVYATGVAYASAIFSFPLVLLALKGLDPLAQTAALAFGLR